MLIDYELKNLVLILESVLLENETLISNELCSYLNAKSKKLRPALLFLFAHALNIDINEKIYNLACAVELIHNASLVHDDIIDNAKFRRGIVSLNGKLGNNLSILAGDLLISSALKQLSKCENTKIISIFSNSLYNMCHGEINQYFFIDKLPNLTDYIKKSAYKTAELFNAVLSSLSYIANIPQKIDISNFAYNFGIAFQIKDDLLNIINIDTSKPTLNDIYNGIFTAPVIYLNEDTKIENLNKEDIITLVKNPKYITKTLELIKKYALIAIKAIDFIPENKYKMEIIKITEKLYKAGVNE